MIWDRPLSLLRRVTMSCRKFTTSCRLCGAEPTIVFKSTNEAANTVKDVILYKFESPRFFKYLNAFALTQYGCWMFIGYSSMGMIDAPVPVKTMTKEESDDLPFWRKINFGADKYKYGLSVGSMFMGFGILCLSWTYILRTVRYLILRKDGKSVAFVTYAPFGRNRIMNVNINDISAAGSRTGGASQLPVKVKGKYLFYLLDLRQGKFLHPELFDRTVGTRRIFR